MRTRTSAVLIVAFLALVVAGCSDTPTNPSPVTFSQTDVRVGTGTEAAAGKKLTVNYTGWLYDPSKPDNKGFMFDTSLGKLPFVFTLGAGEVIPGWDQGVAGQRVGGLRRLVIPPSLAYGGVRRSSIPPYSTLLFEVELLNVE